MSCQTEHSSEHRLGDHAKEKDLAASTNLAISSELRERVKYYYSGLMQSHLGVDMKHYWNKNVYMLPLVNSTPEWHESRQAFRMLCNKSTMLYWQTSAQTQDFHFHARLVFACMYKCWYRCHQSEPITHFGKYLAIPSRITSEGPQTIPDILQAHAYLCDDIASKLTGKKGTGGVTHPTGRNQWQHYHLFPLCRGMITLLDRHSLPPEREEDWSVVLDDEVNDWTVVLVLTGDQRGLSEAINFDAIQSESLPLCRNDIDGIDDANVIRVSMKTAVHFIAGLQHREEKAWSKSSQDYMDSFHNSNGDRVLTTEDPFSKWNRSVIEHTAAWKTDGILEGFKDADEYADAVFHNPSESDWKSRVIEIVKRPLGFGQREIYPENMVIHWSPSWN